MEPSEKPSPMIKAPAGMSTIPSGIELALKWLEAVVQACVATTETETASVAEGAATVIALKKQPSTVPNAANWFLMVASALRVFSSNHPDKPFSPTIHSRPLFVK